MLDISDTSQRLHFAASPNRVNLRSTKTLWQKMTGWKWESIYFGSSLLPPRMITWCCWFDMLASRALNCPLWWACSWSNNVPRSAVVITWHSSEIIKNYVNERLRASFTETGTPSGRPAVSSSLARCLLIHSLLSVCRCLCHYFFLFIFPSLSFPHSFSRSFFLSLPPSLSFSPPPPQSLFIRKFLSMCVCLSLSLIYVHKSSVVL